MRFGVCVAVLALVLASDAARIRHSERNHLSESYPGVDTVLHSEGITNWGTWGPFEKCPSGSFVTGFTLKTHSPVGPDGDNTGVNGIQLFCHKKNGDATMTLKSSSQQWGSWWGGGNCTDGFATGFKLRQMKKLHCGDDVSTTDMQLFCDGPVKQIGGNGIAWGDWLSKEKCPSGQAICGLRTQVEANQGEYRPTGCFTAGDDTALNNIIIGCCKTGLSKQQRIWRPIN